MANAQVAEFRVDGEEGKASRFRYFWEPPKGRPGRHNAAAGAASAPAGAELGQRALVAGEGVGAAAGEGVGAAPGALPAGQASAPFQLHCRQLWAWRAMGSQRGLESPFNGCSCQISRARRWGWG